GTKAARSEIGKKLNVEDVLEGSVKREGNRVRVTAELINTRTGFRFGRKRTTANWRAFLLSRMKLLDRSLTPLKSNLLLPFPFINRVIPRSTIFTSRA